MQAALTRIAAAPRRPVTRGAGLVPGALLEEARHGDDSISIEEYSLARCVASEFGNGSAAEMACIADAIVGMAERRKLLPYFYLTGGTGLFGLQRGGRPASTRQNPNARHLAAAREVLSGELRGIALGARRFFNPKLQDELHAKWRAGLARHKHTCSALGLLRAWCYHLPPCKGVGRCCADGQPPASNPGPHLEQWVGPIPGVDAYRLLLMKPATPGPEHEQAFAAARALIESARPPDYSEG